MIYKIDNKLMISQKMSPKPRPWWILLAILLVGCSGQAYEPGVVEDGNYYNLLAQFALDKPESMSYEETSDISVQEIDPELYSRAEEMGVSDSLRLEYMLSGEKADLYIYSEDNTEGYLVVAFVDFIKNSIEKNTDMEVESVYDLHQEAPFRCLVASNDTYEKRYYVTFADESFVYIVMTGKKDELASLSEEDNPMNYVYGYWGE